MRRTLGADFEEYKKQRRDIQLGIKVHLAGKYIEGKHKGNWALLINKKLKQIKGTMLPEQNEMVKEGKLSKKQLRKKRKRKSKKKRKGKR